MATTMNLDLLHQAQEAWKPATTDARSLPTCRSNIIELKEFSSMARRTKPECPTLHRMPLLYRNVVNANKPNTDIIGDNYTYFENCPLSKVLSDCLDHLANKPLFKEKDLSYDVSIMHSSKILVNQRVLELVLLNLIEGAAILALPHAQIRVLCHRSGSTFQILIKSFRRVDWASVGEYHAASSATSATKISALVDGTLPDDLHKVGSRVAMCREIVSSFGGRVRSEYLAGPYATFVIQMPINK
jgi:light-regulated signal transduction histidine kinase (bacteriophytochrome)